jgi:L-2-hydroxyglutarate oxidase
VNCAGLHNDRVTAMSGAKPPARIVPFRGEYYELTEEAKHLCKHLIYPVPDPNFPFLGVHFTRMIDGKVECGPNAVLALAREGYTWADINLKDLAGTLGWGGFWKMISKHWKTGFGEMHRSLSKKAFTKALSRLMPEIREDHLVKAPAGVRAQALMPDGLAIDDFLFQDHGRVLNVCNAPSPAATSSLSIGRAIVARLDEQL